MRLVNGTWHCRLCGAALLMPPGRRPRTTILGASGKTNVRVLYVGADEIHRCECGLDAITRATDAAAQDR